MGEMIKMVVVLTFLSSFSGGLLAYVKENTESRIEDQVLKFVKGPTIEGLFKDAENDPMADRFTIERDKKKLTFFVAKLAGKTQTVAFETSAKGYGGDVGLMVAVNVATDKIHGVGVTTHSETAGLGAMAKDDPEFATQFAGQPILEPIMVSGDGGRINALSGATITSRAVSAAASQAGETYKHLKPEIEEKLKAFTQ
jgi:electron transport complex protein RnfG